MHVALRAPREKVINVDGENVIPAVHAVLDRVMPSFPLFSPPFSLISWITH